MIGEEATPEAIKKALLQKVNSHKIKATDVRVFHRERGILTMVLNGECDEARMLFLACKRCCGMPQFSSRVRDVTGDGS